MATLAEVVDQLQKQNDHTVQLVDRLDQLAESNTQLVSKFSLFLRDQAAERKRDRLRSEESRREGSADEVKSLSQKIAEFGKGGGFAKGAAEGFLGPRLSEFLSNFLGSTFGTGGVLLTALPRLIGRIVGTLGFAGIVATFGEEALSMLFKQVNESGKLGLSEDQIGSLASDVNDGLIVGILAGLVTKNPFFKLGAFIVGYFKDEILSAVKSLFGITGNEESGYTAKLPFMDEIDLGDSMTAIETTITGVVTAVAGLVTLFIGRKLRGIPNMVRRMLGLTPAAAGAGAGAGAAGAAAGGARAATINAAQRTALSSLDDAALAAAGFVRNRGGTIVRAGTNQFASNAELLNLLASQRNPMFGRLVGIAKKIPALGTIITSGLAASIILDESIEPEEKVNQLGELFGSVLGGVGGAALAAKAAGVIGLTMGPVGGFITGLGGAVIGGFAGGWAGRQIASYILGQEVEGTIPPEVAADVSVDSKSFSGQAIAGQAYTPGSNLSREQVQAVSADMNVGKLPNQQLFDDYMRTVETGEYATPVPVTQQDAPTRMKIYDEFGDARELTNQEQQGYTGQLLAGKVSTADIIQKLSSEGNLNMVVNNYNIDNSDNRSSTSMSTGGGGRSGASSTPLQSRDTELYDWYGSFGQVAR